MVITSPDNFTLDGVSCETVGLYCDTPPVQIMAERNVISYKVGNDMDNVEDDDSFQDIRLQFKCHMFRNGDFDTANIYGFLQGKKKLRYSRNEGFYYRINNVSCTPKETADGERITFSIAFTCSPFKYIDNESTTTITGSGTLTNIGTRYSKPLYKCTLSSTFGEGSFIVNGQAFRFSIPQGKIVEDRILYVDAENAIVYSTSGDNYMPYTIGDIPYLSVGSNTVQVSGFVSTVEITPHGRCY